MHTDNRTYEELVADAGRSLVGSRTWNRSQVDRWVKQVYGPLARSWGRDDTEVVIGLEVNGVRSRLGSGKARVVMYRDGKPDGPPRGAYKEAFLNTFIRPLEAKVKMEEENKRQVALIKAKAEALAEDVAFEHMQTLANPEATQEQRSVASEALETYSKNHPLNSK